MDTYLQGYRRSGAPDSALLDDMTRDPRCPETGGAVEAVYDLGRLAAEVDRDRLTRPGASLWDWRALLPVRDPAHVVSLAEGATPLLRAHRLGEALGVRNLWIKDESRNPTTTFKDRGASVTASKCAEVGVTDWILASSGNAAVAFSAYAAAAGVRFYGFIRADTSPVNRLHAQVTGQRIFSVEGGMVEGTRLAAAVAERFGFFHCTQPYNLYRIEGKKTLGLEIAAQLGWRGPDHIFLPTSGGTNALAVDKAFAELRGAGWSDARPAIEAVQPVGCAPIEKAWREGTPVERWPDPTCRVLGLGHPAPATGDRVVDIVRESGGEAWLVTDEQCYEAQALVAATEGLFIAPASASTAAAIATLGPEEAARRFEDRTVVLVATGSGKTQPNGPLERLPEVPRIAADLDAFVAANPDL